MNVITLNGRQALKLKRIDSTPLTDKKEQSYVRFAYGKTVFITRADFFTAWEAGNIAELDLIEGVRTVKNDEGIDQDITSYELGGFITNTQDLASASHSAKVSAIVNSAKYDVNSMMADAVGA